jgi:AP-1 complex subunit sigma 1/2
VNETLAHVIFSRYASLYFVVCVDNTDNELIILETIHHFVEVLDRYFGNVCELDLIFNFHKVGPLSPDCIFCSRGSSFFFLLTQAYFILDEMMMAGELQETSKKNVLRILAQQDIMHETTGQDASKFEL